MTSPLLYRVDRFLKESGMPPTLFGRLAVRDPRLIGDLRNGRQPGPRVVKNVEHFMNKWKLEMRETSSC
ncbi:MAG: hypothetical protein HC788_07965 [Sphingopyxis sp.]|nr:hypothetical protein [Sphingopyxis sp.]